MRANMEYIKGAYSLTPSPYPHQAIHPIPRMPPMHSSSSSPLPTQPASLFAHCKNLQIKSNRLIFTGVSEAVHWTAWLRGKINAALSGRSNSICRFGLSHSVFITPNKSIVLCCVCEKSVWVQDRGSCVYSYWLEIRVERNVHYRRKQFLFILSCLSCFGHLAWKVKTYVIVLLCLT